MIDLSCETISSLHKLLIEGKINSVELTELYLNRIEQKNNKINAYVSLNQDAIKEAREADLRIQAKKNVTELTGIPIGLKDIFLKSRLKTTCASNILKNYIAPYTGTAVQKLADAGAVIIGKLNMDEFAMGSSTEHTIFGPTHNPWNHEYIAGGSSGGSTAAVAASFCAAALGTDTGGSIRQPSSCCNVVGLKPTYGRVSRYGVVAFASSLDQVGPITTNVADCAIMLKTIAGHDPKDSTSHNIEVPDYTKFINQNIKGLTIGIPKEYLSYELDEEILLSVNESIKILKTLGAKCIDISLPHTKYAVPTYYIIAPAEASSNLARYDGIRFGYRSPNSKDLQDLYEQTRSDGFGPEVKLRIIMGTYVLSSGYYDAYYIKAQKVRTLIKKDFQDAFKKCDTIIAPAMPTPPFKLGEKLSDPLQMYLSDIFTIPVNLAGLPAISVPYGFSKNKLPIGIQFIGNLFDEATLIKVAHAYESTTQCYMKKPEL